MTALDTLDILRHYFSLRRGDMPAITTLVRLPALPPPAGLLPLVGPLVLPVEGRHHILRHLRREEEVEHVRP